MRRRSFLRDGSAGLLSSLLLTRFAVAAAPTDNRLIVVVLRGGLDALHALPPHADPIYHQLRPQIGFGAPNSDLVATDLDGYFGLHPALTPLLPLYRSGDLSFLPAAATAYRARSHFDGQNMLENGSQRPFGARDGWLNRAIGHLNAGDSRLGLALGPALPLLMQGDTRVQTWSDSGLPEVDPDFLLRLTQMYQHDALFADALHDARGTLKPNIDMETLTDTRGQARDVRFTAQAAADLLTRPKGPRVAVMDMSGWDTHFAQERRLRTLLGTLAQAILDIKSGLGPTWSKTVVMVVSEFGRTAAENGAKGTDHGTGGLAILAGGAVKGGKIAGAWPGLHRSALYEDRDLRAVNAYESLFKFVLMQHLGLDEAIVEDNIFPNSADYHPLYDLLVDV